MSTDGGTNWAPTTAAQSSLGDGSYRFRAVVSDAAGNSAPTASVSVTLDRTAPSGTPTPISSYVDNVGAAQGPTATAAITDDATPGLNIGDVPADARARHRRHDGARRLQWRFRYHGADLHPSGAGGPERRQRHLGRR
jgi:hypothetical protein